MKRNFRVQEVSKFRRETLPYSGFEENIIIKLHNYSTTIDLPGGSQASPGWWEMCRRCSLQLSPPTRSHSAPEYQRKNLILRFVLLFYPCWPIILLCSTTKISNISISTWSSKSPSEKLTPSMEVTWVEEEEAVEEEEVEDGVNAFWTFPPNMRLRSLVQLEPFWPFFMVAGGEKDRKHVSFLCTEEEIKHPHWMS